MIITIVGRSPSWNAICNQNSFWRRKVIVDGIHARVFDALIEQKIPKHLFLHKVNINVTAYCKLRPFDSDNIPAKFYLDPLKGWLFKNDGIQYVGQVRTESKIDRVGTERVEIHIIENSAEL